MQQLLIIDPVDRSEHLLDDHQRKQSNKDLQEPVQIVSATLKLIKSQVRHYIDL